MKVGDKIKLIATGRIGWIIGERSNAWKIDFIDGDKPELVKKTVPIVVVKFTPNLNPKPNPRPKKKKGWKHWLIVVIVALFIIGAIVLTLKNVL